MFLPQNYEIQQPLLFLTTSVLTAGATGRAT